MLRSIRCGRGLGDSLYLQSVVRHLIEKGNRFQVRSDWPAVFLPLGNKAQVTPFSRKVHIVAHYAARKGQQGTTQFQDCCLAAGINEAVDLRLDWRVVDLDLVARVRAQAAGRPILLVQLPRSPMGRTDGFGAELLPDCRVIQAAIDKLRERALVVQVGAGAPLFQFTGIEVDMANATSVSQLLDVAAIADGFLGYCSFMLPLAESFSKPALMVWSSRGLAAKQLYVRQITPKKVIQKASTVAMVDDWPRRKIDEVVHAFIR